MARAHKTGVASSAHRSISDLDAAGASEKRATRSFDRMCLPRIEQLCASEIKSLRERAGGSQAVFEQELGVATGLVSQWKCSGKEPSRVALKLPSLVRASRRVASGVLSISPRTRTSPGRPPPAMATALFTLATSSAMRAFRCSLKGENDRLVKLWPEMLSQPRQWWKERPTRVDAGVFLGERLLFPGGKPGEPLATCTPNKFFHAVAMQYDGCHGAVAGLTKRRLAGCR